MKASDVNPCWKVGNDIKQIIHFFLYFLLHEKLGGGVTDSVDYNLKKMYNNAIGKSMLISRNISKPTCENYIQLKGTISSRSTGRGIRVLVLD